MMVAEGTLVENKGHLLGEGDQTVRDCTVDRSRNITEAPMISQSAASSTRPRAVTDQSATSSTSAHPVSQAVIQRPDAPK